MEYKLLKYLSQKNDKNESLKHVQEKKIFANVKESLKGR